MGNSGGRWGGPWGASVLVVELGLDLAGLSSLRGGGRAQLGGEDPIDVGLSRATLAEVVVFGFIMEVVANPSRAFRVSCSREEALGRALGGLIEVGPPGMLRPLHTMYALWWS